MRTLRPFYREAFEESGEMAREWFQRVPEGLRYRNGTLLPRVMKRIQTAYGPGDILSCKDETTRVSAPRRSRPAAGTTGRRPCGG